MAKRKSNKTGKDQQHSQGNTCSLGEFHIIKVASSEEKAAVDWLYFKKHKTKEKEPKKPQDRTLFVVGVPPFYDQDCIRNVFGEFGSIETVFFQQTPSSGPPPDAEASRDIFRLSAFSVIEGFKVAYVVYEHSDSLRNALDANLEKPRCLRLVRTDCGVSRWSKEYAEAVAASSESLQADIDKFMQRFDEAKAAEQQGTSASEPDEGGWITVSRKGKRPGIPRTEKMDQSLKKTKEKKRKQQELVNFYSFQVREGKVKQLDELRKKFEQDKKRIALMRAARRFRPY